VRNSLYLANNAVFNIHRKSLTLRNRSRRSSGSAFQIVKLSTEKDWQPMCLIDSVAQYAMRLILSFQRLQTYINNENDIKICSLHGFTSQ